MAEKRFYELTQRGFTAIALGENGAENRVLKTFDQEVERTLFIPQLEGGEFSRMGFVATIKSWLRSRPDAERLARQLLREVLSPEQRNQYDSKGFFEVTGGQTGKRYCIRTGSQMNVE